MPLLNLTSFPEFVFDWIDPDMKLKTTCVVRADFFIDQCGGLIPCDNQFGPRHEDTYYGSPRKSSLRTEHDRIPYKNHAEVYFVDPVARPPASVPTPEWEVSVSVGSVIHHRLRVIGERTYHYGKTFFGLGSPKPCASVAVIPENMMCDASEDSAVIKRYKFNPVGLGFSNPGLTRGRTIGPQCVSFNDKEGGIPSLTPAHRAWLPRRAFLGTTDASWLKSRAPLYPLDFSPLFFQQTASHLWSASNTFNGDELVTIKGLGKNGMIEFYLPAHKQPRLYISDDVQEDECFLSLDTIIISPEDEMVSLVWRAVIDSNATYILSFEKETSDE